MKQSKDLVHFDQVLQGAQTVAVGGHVRPDGDCVGAVTSLYRYLHKKHPELKVDAYLRGIPEKVAFLADGIPLIAEVDEADIPVYDLFVCLDCATMERLGYSQPVCEAAGQTVNIDHHISNPMFADINRVEPDASSTCEMLCEEYEPALIDQEIAASLFVGISHDTGIFRYSSTSPKTLEITARLLETGIDSYQLITETYCKKSYAQQRATADAVLRAKLYADGHLFASTMSQAQREALGASSEDMDGIVELMRDTRGVDCSAFLHEFKKGVWKMSLRSADKVDVHAIAGHFGGGGHTRAAGASIETDDPQQVIEQVAGYVSEQLGI